MRQITCLLVAAVCAGACNHSSDAVSNKVPGSSKASKPSLPAGWIEFKPANGTFSVYLPKQPQEQTQTLPSNLGVSGSLHMYAVDAKPTVYLVNDTVVSTQPPAGAGADEMMKGVESGFAGSTHTQVVSSKSEKIGGYQGRRMEFASKDLTFKGFTIVAGKHNFVIITGGATGKFDKENIDNFLASFEVLNPDAS